MDLDSEVLIPISAACNPPHCDLEVITHRSPQNHIVRRDTTQRHQTWLHLTYKSGPEQLWTESPTVSRTLNGVKKCCKFTRVTVILILTLLIQAQYEDNNSQNIMKRSWRNECLVKHKVPFHASYPVLRLWGVCCSESLALTHAHHFSCWICCHGWRNAELARGAPNESTTP